MNKKKFAFLTALIFLADNFLWYIWQDYLNQGLYETTFFLVWIPVIILIMTAIFYFVFIRTKEKKRSPFYFIWSFVLCMAEFGVVLFYHCALDLFAGERSPVVCFIIIMTAFYFTAFYELAAFIDWRNVPRPAPASERRLRKRGLHADGVPEARTRSGASGIALFLRIWAGALSVLEILSGFVVLFFPVSDLNRSLSFFLR